MSDYKAMYYKLAGRVEDALETLEEALREAESMYMHAQEVQLTLQPGPTEQSGQVKKAGA